MNYIVGPFLLVYKLLTTNEPTNYVSPWFFFLGHWPISIQHYNNKKIRCFLFFNEYAATKTQETLTLKKKTRLNQQLRFVTHENQNVRMFAKKRWSTFGMQVWVVVWWFMFFDSSSNPNPRGTPSSSLCFSGSIFYHMSYIIWKPSIIIWLKWYTNEDTCHIKS